MNVYAIRAIYRFEMGRMWRTLLQSVVSPVISTSLYFIVFGGAVGSHMAPIGGVSYGAFIVPGLTMLSLLTISVANASFGIYFPRFAGTIYEILSAPASPLRDRLRLCRRRRQQVDHDRPHHSCHRPPVRRPSTSSIRSGWRAF